MKFIKTSQLKNIDSDENNSEINNEVSTNSNDNINDNIKDNYNKNNRIDDDSTIDYSRNIVKPFEEVTNNKEGNIFGSGNNNFKISEERWKK